MHLQAWNHRQVGATAEEAPLPGKEAWVDGTYIYSECAETRAAELMQASSTTLMCRPCTDDSCREA